MTKKDYELIADTIQSVPFDPGALTPKFSVAQAFADALKATNPRFNREKFLKACGFYV